VEGQFTRSATIIHVKAPLRLHLRLLFELESARGTMKKLTSTPGGNESQSGAIAQNSYEKIMADLILGRLS
jgi:hypothetical protein